MRIYYAQMKAKKKVEKPSSGTVIAAKAREACSKHTKEQRADYIARGMSLIYGNAQKADSSMFTQNFLTDPTHVPAQPVRR